ncbi:MAG: hypothetical protein ACTS3R_07840 [Inquilinaceae bacterium]
MRVTHTVIGAALGVAFFMGASGADALARTPVCAPHAAVTAELAARFGERPVGRGLEARGIVMELFVAADRGGTATWTLVAVRPDGTACLVAAGEAWADVALPADLPGHPS